MDRNYALKIADDILALINSSPRTPSKEQIASLIVGPWFVYEISGMHVVDVKTERLVGGVWLEDGKAVQ